jgi:hypothetical protein
MEDIDPLLEKYEPGNPKMKPDVLKQIAEIEKEREKMAQDEMAKNGKIMLNQPGQQPVALTTPQIIELLSKQSEQLQVYEKRIGELENINKQLQKIISEKPKILNDVGAKPNYESLFKLEPQEPQKSNYEPKSKSEPLFKLDASMI